MRYLVPLILAGMLMVACNGAAVSKRDQRSGSSPITPNARVSSSFARDALAYLASPRPGLRARLEQDPALRALVRHQAMSGNPSAAPEALLTQALANVPDTRAAAAILLEWKGREGALIEAAEASHAFLPTGQPFDGTLHLVVGYDIAVASPPDIVINVAHPHFGRSAEEVAHYATHEAHHVGFLSIRPMPELQGLDDPERLMAVIRFMTQFEGMAVHSAYQRRLDADQLAEDADYILYQDASAGDAIRHRYREVLELANAPGPLPASRVEEILEAMSSGERLWYRFGAMVAWAIERDAGRDALIATIRDPEEFDHVASALLRQP